MQAQIDRAVRGEQRYDYEHRLLIQSQYTKKRLAAGSVPMTMVTRKKAGASTKIVDRGARRLLFAAAGGGTYL